jgi:mono/diheme cytochrome c family protein
MKGQMTLSLLTASLLAAAGAGSGRALAAAGPQSPGQQVYDLHCAACHGARGDGQGPAAVWLFPKPRNFSAGLFKIQSTPAGSMPTDEDLYEVVTRGMPGSSMPSFTYLSESERREVVRHVKFLTAEVEADGKRVNKFEEAARKGELKPPVQVPPEPAMTVEALARGQALYKKLQCFTCHGETGMGDGTSAPTLKDNWGLPLPPRDFTIGAFRGGSTGRDLYLRINSGLAGTPMPPFGEGVITPEERWALVLYIQSLRRKDAEVNDILRPEDINIPVRRVKAVPTEPTDPAWERFDNVRVPLNPLWPEPYPIAAVAVTAVHDGRRLALLCQWKDEIFNGAPVRVQDFQDAMALQFSLKGTTPFLGMGDAENPVNLWFWRAGWQQEVDDTRPDVDLKYAAMHVDTYFATGYQTALDAGNLLARPQKSPVEDANAWGFGSFRSQSPSGQNVTGKGVWRAGFWNVVFLRELKSREAEDIKFDGKNPVPVAFAVWNGEQRDRNGRKVISNWYKLVLEP